MNEGLAAHFGSLELEILEVVWRGGEWDVAQVAAAVPGHQAYTTVKTVMERLTTKGHLARTRRGRGYSYWSTATRQEVQARLAARSAAQLLHGFGSLGIVGFVDNVRDDPEQLAHLRFLLEQVQAGDAAAHQAGTEER